MFLALTMFADNGMLCVGRGTPTIDGKLENEAWQTQSIAATPFLLQKSNRLAMRQTEARFLYDNENLYVSFRCLTDVLDPVNNKLHALKANMKRHDSDAFYNDDGVELLIDNPQLKHVFDITVNANGEYCDAKAPRDTSRMWNERDFSWESGAKIASDHHIEPGNGFWSVEMAIPWKSLGGRPPLNAKWKMVAARFEQDGKEKSAFQTMALGVHDVESFSTLKFIERVPGVSKVRMPLFIPGKTALGIEHSSEELLELNARIKFGNKYENYRAALKDTSEIEFLLNGNGNFQFSWKIVKHSTLQELFTSPEYTFAVNSSVMSAKISNATLLVNDAAVHDKALLRSGSNAIAVKCEENPTVELSCSGWQVPLFDGWKQEENGTYKLNLLSAVTLVWPDWTTCGLHVTRGGIQQLLVLPSGIPEHTVTDYAIALDLPAGMTLLSASGYYQILPDIAVDAPVKAHYRDTDFSRYVIRIKSPREYRKEFNGHELLSCLIGVSKEMAFAETCLGVSSSSAEAGALEIPTMVPVRVLPELQGKQPSRYKIELWSGWTSQMLDKRAFPQLAKSFASAGINEDGSLTGEGISLFALINFKDWNLNCKPFLESHPDCYQIDANGKASEQYVCTTTMLTPEFAAYFRSQLPGWHEHFKYTKHVDWDFESNVFTGSIACLCERCRKSFSETYHLPKVPASLAEIKEKYAKEWTEFMNRRFADMASMMCQAIHKVLPGTVFSVYSGYQSAHTKSFYGVDWSMLNGKIDYAMMGYGRNEAELLASYQALPDTKLILGELLYPYLTNVRQAPTVPPAATLMRRACDANGGILIYEYAIFDGRTLTALAQTSRAIAENEEFFLLGKRCGSLLKVEGFSDNEKEVLQDSQGNYLVIIMNPGKKPRTFNAKFALPPNYRLLDAEGKVVNYEFSGTVPDGQFVIFHTVMQ